MRQMELYRLENRVFFVLFKDTMASETACNVDRIYE